MLDFPRRLVGAVADVTVGTAIVMLHALLAAAINDMPPPAAVTYLDPEAHGGRRRLHPRGRRSSK